jgi:hypothetical protein
MARIAQARAQRLSVMIIGSAAMLLFAPSAAWAGSGDYDHDRHRNRGHYKAHSSHARNHHASHERQHHRGKWRGHKKHHVGYYCKPCNHYFSARDELYDHVAYRHHVPFRHLTVAVSFGAFGWIFFG